MTLPYPVEPCPSCGGKKWASMPVCYVCLDKEGERVPTDDLDLAALERRLVAARLPWSVGHLDRALVDADGDVWGEMETRGGAALIVAAVNALPALLARLRAAEAENAKLRETCAEGLSVWTNRALAAEARVAALEAAAGTHVKAETYTVNAGYQRCRRCYHESPRHAPDCTLGALVALLSKGGA
jgi:hypothetical protein